MQSIEPGSDAQQSPDTLKLDLAALNQMALKDLLKLRDSLYVGFHWSDEALPFIEPIWSDLVAVVEQQILLCPITSPEELFWMIRAISAPDNPWLEGLHRLRVFAIKSLDAKSGSEAHG